jgi:hypothetical protein
MCCSGCDGFCVAGKQGLDGGGIGTVMTISCSRGSAWSVRCTRVRFGMLSREVLRECGQRAVRLNRSSTVRRGAGGARVKPCAPGLLYMRAGALARAAGAAELGRLTGVTPRAGTWPSCRVARTYVVSLRPKTRIDSRVIVSDWLFRGAILF